MIMDSTGTPKMVNKLHRIAKPHTGNKIALLSNMCTCISLNSSNELKPCDIYNIIYNTRKQVSD